jgi:excisionase family DNA binding protein
VRALKTRTQGPGVKAPAQIPYKKGRVEQKTTWLTPEESAGHLKVKTRTLLAWIRQGKVKAFALSGTKRRIWRLRMQDLDAALMESPVLPSITPAVLSETRRTQ